MRAAALEVQPEHAPGVTAAELAVRCRAVGIGPHRLQQWLVSRHFATLENGVLVATALGRQVGGSLRPLEGCGVRLFGSACKSEGCERPT